MIAAIADTKAALSLSVYFEITKKLCIEAAEERDRVALNRANLKMQDDRFEDLPLESQRELTMLFAKAITAVRGWGAP